MHSTFFRPLALAALGAAALLVACGGSSDPESNDTGETETPAPVHPVPDLAQACPLPVPVPLSADTETGAFITSKDVYQRARAVFQLADGSELDLSVRLKGRGNSTWTAMDKKPYKLKLDDKTGLLGMASGKDWAMLANHADKTLLRNELAFCMARVQGMPYTPESRFAELTLNGRYDGVYQITNKSYPVEDRIKADAKAGVHADDPHDAFLLELDFAHRKDDWIQTDSGLYYNIRFDSDPEQMQRITDWMNALEALIADRADPDRLQKVADIVDLPSLADWFLINELTANPDGWLSSTYLYRLKGGKLTFGPVWDFDQAFGPTQHNIDPEGWISFNRSAYDQFNWYFRELMAEPGFVDIVRQRWQQLHARVPDFVSVLQASASALDAAQQRNFERWPILDELIFTNVFALGSYADEVDFVDHWLTVRAHWMDQNIDSLLNAF